MMRAVMVLLASGQIEVSKCLNCSDLPCSSFSKVGVSFRKEIHIHRNEIQRDISNINPNHFDCAIH